MTDEEYELAVKDKQERRITRLNEDQATLLITFLRNNDRVVRFKVALVSAFSQIKKQQLQPQLPANYIEALESLVISEKEKALALEQLQEQAPKIAVYEQLADRKEDINTSTLAKMLGTSAIKLNQWLKLKGYKWMGKDLPKAGYESWFNLVCGTNNERGYTQCLITAKGQLEIAKRWAKDFKGNNNE